MILKKIAGRETPKEILRMVEKVLEDDAEVIKFIKGFCNKNVENNNFWSFKSWRKLYRKTISWLKLIKLY